MPAARTPGRWPYRAAAPGRRRRVVRRDDAPRGVRALADRAPRFRVTPLQARLGLAAALVFCAVSAAWWAYHSPWLTVRQVTVSGTQSVAADDVRAAAGLDGKSVFSLDPAGARARIAALPRVSGVTVRKQEINGVRIDVQERTVWGAWQINGVNVPIDDEGYVLDGDAVPEGAPVIVEVDPQRAVRAGDRLDPGAVELAARLQRESDTALGRKVLALVYRQSSGLTAVLSGATVDDHGVWVTFGDSRDYDYKVAALYVLLERARQDELALNAVDLRFGDRLSFN